LLFVIGGFDHLPAALRAPARELERAFAERREASARIARLLALFRREGVLPDRYAVVEHCVRRGLSAAEARQFDDAGVALEKTAGLEGDLRTGAVSLQSAGEVGRIAKDEALHRRPPGAPPGSPPVPPVVALAGWREAARTLTARELRTLVQRRIEEVSAGDLPVETMAFHVPRGTRAAFGRAREVASKRAGDILTWGQTLAALVEHYLREYDPARAKPRIRRAPDTRGRPGRYVPAEVRREVLARSNGGCCFPACSNHIWVQFAHRKPHRKGGSREADNGDGLCHHHHVRRDRGEFTIVVTPDGPVFYDAKGRRIGANGRVEEEPGAASERGPP
jgi:hypothetical protein